MKILQKTILIVALLAFLSVPAFAQSKVATVDMRKLFSGYYKTKLAEAALDKSKLDLRKEIKDMADDLDKAKADYKQLLADANNQIISAEERDRRQQAAAAKLKDISDRQSAIESFNRQAESRLADQSQRLTGNIVTEIQKVVASKAKAGSFTLVLNSATSEVVVYAGTENDLTDATLKELNAGAPIDMTMPATAPSLMGTNGVP